MKRGLWLIACSMLVACVSASGLPKPASLAQLRREAEAHPQDPRAWRELALAELLGAGGDARRAERAAVHAYKLDHKSPEVALAQGLLADVHGHPSAALDAYLVAIELAVHSKSPVAQQVIEAASYSVQGQSGMTRGYVERVSAHLLPLIDAPELSLAARSALVEVLLPVAERRGDLPLVARLSTRLGCPREFRVAGPFGPRELLGFDAAPPADLSKPLAASYDLGPSRGVREVRSLQTHACTLHMGGGPVAEAGQTLAEAKLDVAVGGEQTFRLDTPNNAELFLDGHSVLRVDRRSALGARVVFAKLPLTAGSHRLVVRVSSRHPNPVLELAVVPSQAADAQALQLPAARLDAPGLGLYLRVALALARGDVLLARQALSVATRARDASALLLLQRAAVALSDPLLPDGVRGDDARRYLMQAAQRDTALWGPVLQMASLAAKSGRVKEAIAVLRKAESQWPEVPAIGLSLVELLRGKSFQAAADRALARVRELVPDACVPMGAELESLRARDRYQEALELATKLVACDAETNALYTMLVERRDYAAAKTELARLRALQSDSSRYAMLSAELSLAKNMGDAKAVEAAIAELRSRYPRSYNGAIEQVDWLVANGQKPAAIEALEMAQRAEPTAMANMQRVLPVLGKEHILAAYRKDGAATIKAFEASDRKYAGPQVLVLDYMVARVFSDGSSLDLVHTIQKAQSHEAIDHLAEVEVPEGAQVLTLRSIKPDGRRLEADGIANKTTISLPNVASGDYVELEYLQANGPAEGFPSGYLGDRFYFKSFEVPFDHSQIVMILPADMPYKIDPRGPAPAVAEKVADGLRVLDFHVDESVPLVEEPNSVSAREFIPSIRVGVNATYEAMVESLRDVLVDRDLYDGYYANLAHQIIGDAGPTDYRLRAERLYNWVLANVENQNDVFSQAALMLRAKAGNRARVLHYLLGLVQVPSQLALARTFGGDAQESTMADAETYDHLLLRVDAAPSPAAPIWLFTNERWAPFGFLPPGLRGQPALMLAAGAARVRVSEGLLGADTRRFSVRAALAADGGARIDITEALHGSEAIAWREQLEQIPEAELNHRMEQDYVARLLPGASLVSLELSGREQDHPELVLRYVVQVPNFARPVPGGLALPALLPSEISANFARTATRKTTELVPSPVQTEISAVIELPAGYALAAAPTPQKLVGAFGGRPNFTDRVGVEANVLRLERVLSLPQMRVATEDYPAFAEFCRRVDEVEGRELLLRKL